MNFFDLDFFRKNYNFNLHQHPETDDGNRLKSTDADSGTQNFNR